MIKIIHTLLLSVVLTTTIHSMVPKIEITESKGNKHKSEKKGFLTQSMSSLSSRGNSPTRHEDSPTQTLSADNSPRKKHIFSSFSHNNASVSHEDPETDNPLIDAVKANDMVKIQTILNINTPDQEGNTAFILAAKNNQIKTLHELLNQSTLRPNIQNLQKMTALLCAAQHGHADIVTMLTLDPRIDSSIQEKNNLTALNYLDMHKKCHDIKLELFGRITLDTFVNQEVAALQKLIINKKHDPHITEDDLNISVKLIKKAIEKIANNQTEEDRTLPASAIIPHYAKDKFIKQMVQWRLLYRNEETLSFFSQILLLQESTAYNTPEKDGLLSLIL